MKTKGQNLVAFILMIVVLAGVVLVALTGFGSFEGVFADGSITLGLDLAGGSRIVYEAKADDVKSDQMEAVLSMMRARLDTLGYTEATVAQEGNKRIVVEIPSISDPSEAAEKIGATAEVTFKLYDGTVVLASGDIENAKAAYGDARGHGIAEHFVSLTLKKSAVTKFANATEKAAGYASNNNNYISICLDNKSISAPRVTERLTTDSVMITGNFTQADAEYLAGVISAGQLPFALDVVQRETVGETLGDKALQTSLFAGAIGIILVMVIMIVVYRLPGIVSSIALIGYTATMGLLLCLFKVNLSLAGIAGIILSIGMAVDANVIIFERMKEEMSLGRSTKAALDAGFKKAFVAIFDSNITTIMAAVVLWIMGTGSVQGFAITLLIGVILSMFFACLITRFMLSRIVGMKITNTWLYGLKKKKEEA